MENYKKTMLAICNYACGKYYVVRFNHGGSVFTAKGILDNYYNGNIVLISEDGLYHIKYKDVVMMIPTNMPTLDKFSKEYRELLKVLLEEAD